MSSPRVSLRLLIVPLLALSGCISTGEVTPMGPDQYMVSTHQQGGFPDTGDLQRRNAIRAAAYCTAQGKQMSAQSTEAMNNSGFRTADTTFLFRCS
jgi:hypothetical protein